MPMYIRDRIVLPASLPPYFEVEVLSVTLSAIAYGIVVVLSGNCFHLLLNKRDSYSNRMRIILPIYVIVMLLTSTWKIIGSIYILMHNLTFKRGIPKFLYSFGFPLTLTMWGADGFMIWRCLVLYQDISRGLRVGIIALLSLISFTSFVSGVVMFVEQMILVRKLLYANLVFNSLSTVINVILALLIVARLVYHRRYVRNTLGVEHGSPYSNVITMCIESSALMVVVGSLCTILAFVSQNGINIMYDITPHICVISPLLIVYRVALGGAIPPTLLRSDQVMAQIQFNIPVSNPSGQEG